MEAQVTLLDVVPVAPKDRFESIMSAWQALLPEGVLELNVDHDPSCMYYTLRATQGEDAFTFEYIERGPLFWRVRVTKRAA
jgi:regulator of cell morphogenesis and NO signaling